MRQDHILVMHSRNSPQRINDKTSEISVDIVRQDFVQSKQRRVSTKLSC